MTKRLVTKTPCVPYLARCCNQELTGSVEQFSYSHEACQIHGHDGAQCLQASPECPSLKANVPLAPSQTGHSPYATTGSEPPTNVNFNWAPIPYHSNFILASRPPPDPTFSLVYSNMAFAPALTPALTPPRMANPRNSELTSVCGVVSTEKRRAVHTHSKDPHFLYHCPRCDKGLSRRYTVKQHFPGCILKHGNPEGLKWTDHPSMQGSRPYHTRRPNGWNFNRLIPTGRKPFCQMSTPTQRDAGYGNP